MTFVTMLLQTEPLPPWYRLALGSSLEKDRELFAALFALDTRLERSVREASEPIIAQMKLAWWRDRFNAPVSDWPSGEPILAALADAHLASKGLIALVDGWEAVALAAPEGEGGSALGLIEGRKRSWLALAERIDGRYAPSAVEQAASSFTLASPMIANLPDAVALKQNAPKGPKPVPLPRSLRPLAVLGALGARASRKGRPIMDGFQALALALRVGLTGR